MLKLFMQGDNVSPEASYRLALDDKIYDKVRYILTKSKEKLLSTYSDSPDFLQTKQEVESKEK